MNETPPCVGVIPRPAMRRVLTALLTAACLALTVCAEQAVAQASATVGFRSELKSPVIVQGYSIVAGAPRKGQPVIVAPKRIGIDSNVPPGPRFYNIYDANQP